MILCIKTCLNNVYFVWGNFLIAVWFNYLRAIHEEIYVVHAVLWSVNVFPFDNSINALLNHINHALCWGKLILKGLGF